MIKVIITIILLSSWAANLKAQEIFGISDSLRLNFGYPTIKVLDDFQFIDENDNNHIDPGETSVISFTIENTGKYLAKELSIHPKELNNIEGLEVSETVDIGNIEPGESRMIQVVIASSEELQKGTASLIFYIHENGKYDDISVSYAVGTGKKE